MAELVAKLNPVIVPLVEKKLYSGKKSIQALS